MFIEQVHLYKLIIEGKGTFFIDQHIILFLIELYQLETSTYFNIFDFPLFHKY